MKVPSSCAKGCIYASEPIQEFTNGRKLHPCENCAGVMAFSGWRQLDSHNQGTLARIYGAEKVREAVDA